MRLHYPCPGCPSSFLRRIEASPKHAMESPKSQGELPKTPPVETAMSMDLEAEVPLPQVVSPQAPRRLSKLEGVERF